MRFYKVAPLFTLIAVTMAGGDVLAEGDPTVAARAEGDALLARAGAADLFVNETDAKVPGLIKLRHKQSGFLCIFNSGRSENNVELFPSSRRGADVGCATRTVTGRRAVFFTWSPERSVEQILAEEGKATLASLPGAKLGKAQPGDPPTDSSPYRSANYFTKNSVYRIVVGKVGDWGVISHFQGEARLLNITPVLDQFWVGIVNEQRRFADTPQSARSPVQMSMASTPPAILSKEEQIVAAKAEADRLIQVADAADVFENVTTDEVPKVRHRMSGMVCDFPLAAQRNSLTVMSMQPRGSDVSCGSLASGVVTSLFATRFPAAATVDDALKIYLEEIRGQYPDMAFAKGRFADMTTNQPGAPPIRTRRMTLTYNGSPAFSRLAVALVNGWVIEQRLTASLDVAQEADLRGGSAMLATVSGIGAPPAN